VVVNAAAWTAVDLAETHEQEAMAANALAPGHLARACAEVGAALVHISTDYVFDGSAGRPYTPEDAVCPINAYGRTKAEGERAIRAALDQHVILRTSWVVGPDRPNFVATMVRLARRHTRLTVVSDQLGGLTPVDELARAVCAVLADPAPWGTWHVSGRPWASWADVAQHIMNLLGTDTVVEPVPSTMWPAAATRPLDGRLDTTAFEDRFGVHIDWKAHLPQLVAAWKDAERA
jgi:dTDP-4-dehydrorhamnose reductase